MKILVKARHLALTNDLAHYVKRRLRFALDERFDQVKRVEVTLSDINGPKGGEDKRCQMLFKIKGQPDVVIDDVHTHVHAAVDSAAERAARTVSKRITRLKQKTKRFKDALRAVKSNKRDKYLREDFELYELAGGS